MEKIIRDFELYQSAESENLRKIRRHRSRRNEWRNVQRVRKIRGRLIGLAIIAGSAVVTALGDGYGILGIIAGFVIMITPDVLEI